MADQGAGVTADYSAEYDPDLDFDHWYTVLTARRIERFLGREDVILELGSATGLLTQALARHQRRFVCVERSGDYVARARARGLRNTHLEHDLIENVRSGLRFDHVLAINVLHELPDQAGAVARIKTFMRPETLLHVTLPNPASLHRASALGSGMIADLCEQSDRGRQFGTVRLQHADEFVSQMAGLGLVEVWREPVLAKPLPNQQMARLSKELIEAYDKLAYAIPEAAAMHYFVFRQADE